ncbi:MAG: hypothetical protein M3P91_01130 [Actinomycetota bacterium]|nr:hypothetical protein [Actinomycetota bacterium]
MTVQHRAGADSARLTAPGQVDRLTGAYTDRALNLADYKRRSADIESNAERALRRLAELDAAPAEEPAAPVVRSFADTWPTLNIDVRRDVAGALLTSVRLCQDKTVEIRPRCSDPVTIALTIEVGRALDHGRSPRPERYNRAPRRVPRRPRPGG